MTTFKYFFIFVTACILTIVYGLEDEYSKKLSKPFYKYSISNEQNKNLNNLINSEKYFSNILYVKERPVKLSNEKYAENLVNIQNELNLPQAFKSEKIEIIDFLVGNDYNHKKRKRQVMNYDDNIVIKVTIFGKEDDIIIIKEVIPEKLPILTTYEQQRFTTPSTTTTTRKQPYSWEWYPTLRTIPAWPSVAYPDITPATTTTSTTTSNFVNLPNYDEMPENKKENETPSWAWYFPKVENQAPITTTTTEPTTTTTQETPSTTTKEQSWEFFFPRVENQTPLTTTTTEPNYWTTTETLLNTTTTEKSSWGFFFPRTENQTPSTTTTIEPDYWSNVETVSDSTTTQKSAWGGWLFPLSTVKETTTTTTPSSITTTSKPFGFLDFFG